MVRPARVHQARVARYTRGNPDDPRIPVERAAMYAARLEERMAEILAKAPPFTEAQKDRLCAVLRGADLTAESRR